MTFYDKEMELYFEILPEDILQLILTVGESLLNNYYYLNNFITAYPQLETLLNKDYIYFNLIQEKVNQDDVYHFIRLFWKENLTVDIWRYKYALYTKIIHAIDIAQNFFQDVIPSATYNVDLNLISTWAKFKILDTKELDSILGLYNKFLSNRYLNLYKDRKYIPKDLDEISCTVHILKLTNKMYLLRYRFSNGMQTSVYETYLKYDEFFKFLIILYTNVF